ncbi:diacylglycerol/lipid kinase family protein [Streptomyces heilongjiangensis]|uniref:Diacylglycerol/lipid kinase family protein n=1 Tax=Streptomyces heilongjiangensis TaxID=945052 RepID=A0ABW1AZB9_9ACTN
MGGGARESTAVGGGGRGGSAGWARLALLALAASVLVPLVTVGPLGLLWAAVGLVGLALAAVGVWWTLAHTGVVRTVGVVLCATAPLLVPAVYAATGVLWPVLVSLALWVLAMASAHIAVAYRGTADEHAAAPPRHPWILMNPRSGGGKVGRFHLEERARAAGAEVVLLDGGPQDVAGLARRAVADGADLLAVAGGDGTQALVAEVAARNDLPFLVIPAGTRNHFALDLGLDRDDPARALEALTDGVDLRVDLGFAADRVFVNNASFGTYAAVVGDPDYRGRKVRTSLRMLPGLLTGADAPRLGVRAGDAHAEGLQALLVSNNPYLRAVDAARPGRRQRLDSGLLGLVCVRVGNTAQAAAMMRGARSGGLLRLTARTAVVEADTATVPVGVDGEHVVLPAPVRCRLEPGALRVRVPRHRPGTPLSGATADWPRVTRLALGLPVPGGRRSRGATPPGGTG